MLLWHLFAGSNEHHFFAIFLLIYSVRLFILSRHGEKLSKILPLQIFFVSNGFQKCFIKASNSSLTRDKYTIRKWTSTGRRVKSSYVVDLQENLAKLFDYICYSRGKLYYHSSLKGTVASLWRTAVSSKHFHRSHSVNYKMK